MQPSDSSSINNTSNNITASVIKQVKHDKQESDISVYRSMQNTKEESSDESTIISSQTSTLTRNQGCDELQTAVTLRLEELANCLDSPEEEEEEGEEEREEEDDGGSESRSEDSDSEEGIIVEFVTDNSGLEDLLENEVNHVVFCFIPLLSNFINYVELYVQFELRVMSHILIDRDMFVQCETKSFNFLIEVWRTFGSYLSSDSSFSSNSLSLSL